MITMQGVGVPGRGEWRWEREHGSSEKAIVSQRVWARNGMCGHRGGMAGGVRDRLLCEAVSYMGRGAVQSLVPCEKVWLG